MTTTRTAMLAIIALAFCWTPSFAFDVACGMVCADNSPGSSCMSSCAAGNGGGGGGGGARSRNYGAIALSPSTLKYGYSFRFASRGQAEEAALTYCYSNKGNPRDCKVVIWYYDACASLAIKPNRATGDARDGAWGAHWSSSRASARKKALAACQSVAASGCKTELTTCVSQ